MEQKKKAMVIDTKSGFGVSAVRVEFNMSAIFQLQMLGERLAMAKEEAKHAVMEGRMSPAAEGSIQAALNLLDHILAPVGMGKGMEDIFAEDYSGETANCKKGDFLSLFFS